MKKSFLILGTFVGSLLYAQSGIMISPQDFLQATPMSYSTVASKGTGGNLKYSDISGSPYLNEKFAPAKIAADYENTSIRYNVFKDEIEFQLKDEVRVVPKEETFNRIEFINPKQTLVYTTLNGQTGYFYELTSGKTNLYKKAIIKFDDFVKARSSYDSDKPASFTSPTFNYYIKSGDKIISKPKSEKDIYPAFPGREGEIKDYVKMNKIKFNNELDLIKLVKFLNQ